MTRQTLLGVGYSCVTPGQLGLVGCSCHNLPLRIPPVPSGSFPPHLTSFCGQERARGAEETLGVREEHCDDPHAQFLRLQKNGLNGDGALGFSHAEEAQAGRQERKTGEPVLFPCKPWQW